MSDKATLRDMGADYLTTPDYPGHKPDRSPRDLLAMAVRLANVPSINFYVRPLVSDALTRMRHAARVADAAAQQRADAGMIPDEVGRARALADLAGHLAVIEAAGRVGFDDACTLSPLFDMTTVRPATAAQQVALDRHPALAAWHGERVASAQATDRHTAEQRQRQIDEAEAERERAMAEATAARQAAILPDLVRRLAASGITLTTSAKGITARPAALLMPSERELIAEHKDALTKLLRSEELVA